MAEARPRISPAWATPRRNCFPFSEVIEMFAWPSSKKRMLRGFVAPRSAVWRKSTERGLPKTQSRAARWGDIPKKNSPFSCGMAEAYRLNSEEGGVGNSAVPHIPRMGSFLSWKSVLRIGKMLLRFWPSIWFKGCIELPRVLSLDRMANERMGFERAAQCMVEGRWPCRGFLRWPRDAKPPFCASPKDPESPAGVCRAQRGWWRPRKGRSPPWNLKR